MKLDRLEQWATVRHFRLVVALHEYGSILHASHSLNLSQPTASKLLNELEIAIGAQLFIRNRRGVSPTEIGRTFIDRSKMILSQIEHVSQVIDALGNGEIGKVTIGTMLTGSSHLVPAAIEKLWTSKPDIQVKVIEGISDELIPRLITGELDFVMGRLSDVQPSDIIQQEAMFNEDAVIVARNGHPLSLRSKARIEDLAQASWVLPPTETDLRKHFNNLFYKSNINAPHASVETASMFNTLWLIKKTELLGILPRSIVFNTTHTTELTCLSTFEPLVLEKIGILQLKGKNLSPASIALVNCLREVVQNISQFLKV